MPPCVGPLDHIIPPPRLEIPPPMFDGSPSQRGGGGGHEATVHPPTGGGNCTTKLPWYHSVNQPLVPSMFNVFWAK